MKALISSRALAKALGVDQKTLLRWAKNNAEYAPLGVYWTATGPVAAYTPAQARFLLDRAEVPKAPWEGSGGQLGGQW